MTDKQTLKTAILFELKMCSKYPNYHSMLFYVNNRITKKIVIKELLKEIVSSCSNYLKIKNYCHGDIYKTIFDNGSYFSMSVINENERGQRLHHCIIDNDISSDTVQTVVMPMIVTFGACVKRFPAIDKCDIAHFGNYYRIEL